MRNNSKIILKKCQALKMIDAVNHTHRYHQEKENIDIASFF